MGFPVKILITLILVVFVFAALPGIVGSPSGDALKLMLGVGG